MADLTHCKAKTWTVFGEIINKRKSKTKLPSGFIHNDSDLTDRLTRIADVILDNRWPIKSLQLFSLPYTLAKWQLSNYVFALTTNEQILNPPAKHSKVEKLLVSTVKYEYHQIM